MDLDRKIWTCWRICYLPLAEFGRRWSGSEAEAELQIDDAVAGLRGFEDAGEGGGLAEEGRVEDADGLRGIRVVEDILRGDAKVEIVTALYFFFGGFFAFWLRRAALVGLRSQRAALPFLGVTSA